MTKEERVELRKLWEKRVAAFTVSGQTIAGWCVANDLKTHQLQYWLKKFNLTKKQAQRTPQWVPVTVTDQDQPVSKGGSLRITCGGATIDVPSGFDPKLLADVIRVLKSL